MFFCELNEIKSLAQQLQPCPSDLNKDYPGPNSDFIWPEAKALLCLKTQPQIKKPKKKISTSLPVLQIWSVITYDWLCWPGGPFYDTACLN
jgi:hypothetical protein